MNFKSIDGECKRTYYFPNGELQIERVVGLCVRESGTHRLVTADGTKWIVPSGWIGIKIDAADWSI